jgi:hypothetical protein
MGALVLAFPDFVDVDHTLDARSAHPPARLGPLKKDMEGVMMKTYVAALAATATLLLASVRKLPRQADTSKVELPAVC